ncbi:MAG: hypothetical protein U1E78_04750 [Gammaproteobacteria bacterium]
MKPEQVIFLNTPWDWLQRIGFRFKNYIQTSKLGVYIHQLQFQSAYYTILGMMKWNGITGEPGAHPIWSFLAGKLSDEALQNGVASIDLYLINRKLNLFGESYHFKAFRVCTLMSVAAGENNLKNFANVPARALFNYPRLLSGYPFFPARPFDSDAIMEKGKIKQAFVKNYGRLWQVTDSHCQKLHESWQVDKSAPYNIASFVMNILTDTVYGVEALHPEFSSFLSEFEELWFHVEKQTVEGMLSSKARFHEISKQMRVNQKPADEYENRSKDLMKELYKFHAERTTFISREEDFDVAGFLSIVGNLPRAIIRLVYHVIADEALMNAVNQERERLFYDLKVRQIDLESKEAFDYIRNHSELFQRIFFEVMRVSFVVPAMVRLNTNVFFNGAGNWKINDDYEIKTRTLAILPQQRIAMNDHKYKDPASFNPFRDEYVFEKDESGVVRSSSAPLVFGPLNSARACPGRFFTEDLIKALLVWLPIYQEFNLSPDEKLKLDFPPERELHHAPLDERMLFGDVSIKGCLTPRFVMGIAHQDLKDDVQISASDLMDKNEKRYSASF